MGRVTKLSPVFKVANVAAALDYYRDRLGFTASWTWGEPIERAGVAKDDFEIQLDGGAFGAPPGPSVVYCHMDGVDTYFDDCRARGAIIGRELDDRPWHMRDFQVHDLDGNQIGFGSALY